MNAAETRGIYIVGTDTDVGKTVVGSCLARLLRNKGVDVGVFKPLESGCEKHGGSLVPADAVRLMNAASVEDRIEEVCPFRLETPVAPAVAALMEGREIRAAEVVEKFRLISSKHEFMLVEAAGGLYVPATFDAMNIDLVERLNLPVLLVARNRLGTINHTLLSLHLIQERRVRLAGVILNRTMREKGPDEDSNAQMISANSNAIVWGVLPHLEKESAIDYDLMAAALENTAPGLAEYILAQ